MANNPYGYTTPIQNMQAILISETETGSNRAPLMLLNIEDFSSWRGRFETHLNDQNTNLWQFIAVKYERPVTENTLEPVAINSMTPQQRLLRFREESIRATDSSITKKHFPSIFKTQECI